MGIFGSSSKMDVMKKTQENLELSQKNLELMSTALERVPANHATHLEPEITVLTDEEKRKAAYALNLCMISVSQIIDYNDIYILEQEYDAILNNLNIEEMPKDEALLNILKQLLDVVTFFRIQEGEKEFIEKEYQQKMKNAIWSAVPNLSIIFAGGSVTAVALSLASQIGIGYMNYRKEKAQNLLDKEKADWQLQRSAMEQFNGLRRELFDTAWRLADKYNFPDKYRITEKQISRYNEILLDNDHLRRYERLEYIRDKFEAYPPYWYYLGNAANMVYQDRKYDESTREKYSQIASVHFKRFINRTEQNLLREDQLLASCALEYFDLLLSTDNNKDENLLNRLLSRAIEAAGNAFDVLELCAFSYLKIGNYLEAAKLLRMLVNEDYNKNINAQLLSSIYVKDFIGGNVSAKDDYNTLCTRVYAKLLFPMPKTTNSALERDRLQDEFLCLQRGLLLEKYAISIKEILTRYTVLFNKSIPAPDGKQDIHDSYYYDNAEAQQEREKSIRLVFKGNKQNDYLRQLDDFIDDILNALNGLFSTIYEFPGVKKADEIGDCIEKQLRNNSTKLKNLQDKIRERDFITTDLDTLLSINFAEFTKEASVMLVKEIKASVYSIKNMEGISLAESELYGYCLSQNIQLPETSMNDIVSDLQNTDSDMRFDIQLLFDMSEEEKDEYEKSKKMLSCIKEHIHDLLAPNAKKIELYVKGDNDFNAYITRHQKDLNKGKILAVINDTRNSDEDWLLRTDGIQKYYRLAVFKFKKNPIAYNEITKSYKQKMKILIGKDEFDDDRIDLNKFYNLIEKLSKFEIEKDDNTRPTVKSIDVINLPEQLPAKLLEKRLRLCRKTGIHKKKWNRITTQIMH